jgi:peptidoglycan/xylan/chitin deacetylase (PgdA/CDA1 family)
MRTMSVPPTEPASRDHVRRRMRQRARRERVAALLLVAALGALTLAAWIWTGQSDRQARPRAATTRAEQPSAVLRRLGRPRRPPASALALAVGADTLGSIPPWDAVRAGAPTRRMVALTFDDGPSAFTSAVLARLQRVGAHATFFVVGRAVRARPATVAATVAAGQELGDHTYSHGDMRREQRRVRADELLATLALVRQATHGRGAPVLFRPPYGSTSIPINEQARALGLLPVVWTVDTRDWAGLSTAQIVQRALAGARPGAIILLHDGGGDRSRTVAALPAILHGLRRRRLVSVTVARLLRAAPPRDADLTAASLSGAGR